jgi:hypothetical protein
MKILFQIAILFTCNCGIAQSNNQTTLYSEIIALDKAVFDAYNNCEIEKFKSYFTNDVEFYHDKGGVTLTSEKLAMSVKNNLCSDPSRKLRREVVAGTLKVYPMDNYGAILTGEHNFYETTNGVEKLTGKAKFTHLCEFKDNKWRISRVLSYDHRPAE